MDIDAPLLRCCKDDNLIRLARALRVSTFPVTAVPIPRRHRNDLIRKILRAADDAERASPRAPAATPYQAKSR